MEERYYIPPNAFTPRKNFPPAYFVIGDSNAAVHHRGMQLQLQLTENQQLVTAHVSLSNELSAALQDLRHLSAVAGEVKAERDAQVRELYDRAEKMEAEVKLIVESSADLAQTLHNLRKLRSEKKELEEKLNKIHGDVAKISDEWNQFTVMKLEIETMQKEIQRGREVIEHEKRVHASNIKQSQSMEDYKILMAGEIMKLQVEAIDAGKRARAAAAAEADSVPGHLKLEGSFQG